MLLGSTLFAWLVSLVAMLVVLGWTYQRTRLPAVLVYLVWTLLVQTLLPWVSKVLMAHAMTWPSVSASLRLGDLQAGWSALMSVIGSALFVWLLLSLLEWARPGLLRGHTGHKQHKDKAGAPVPIADV